MSVGERIAQLRKERKLSQYQLSKAMGVTRQAVSKWENDLAAPDTLNMIRLADVLDADVEYLATGKQTLSPAAAPPSPPQILRVVEQVEKIVEIERPVPVEKQVFVDRIVEKPIIRRVIRVKYRRNPVEYAILAFLCFLAGLCFGLLL